MIGTSRIAAVVVLGAVYIAASVVFGSGAACAAYPERPVKIVVAAGAGSVSDVRARWLATQLGGALGQPFVVENQPVVGARSVARGAQDGYTLLLAHMGNVIVAPYVTENLGYDPVTDFAPVSRISTGYGVMTCNAQFPARSVADIVRIAREKPGSLNWGNTGVGTPPWMMGVLFHRLAGIEVTHVQYKGGGDLLRDLISGQIDCWMEGALIQTPHIKSGKLRAFAVTSPTRLSFLPDVPTMAEAGVAGFEFQGWTGIVAPSGTPRPVIEKLNAAMRQVLSTPAAADWFADQANVPVVESPEQFAAFIRAETDKWVPVVKTSAPR